jgi:uncharacterized delta-60 repeat protein
VSSFGFISDREEVTMTTPYLSDRQRVLSSIYSTVREQAGRQRALDVIWPRDNYAVANYMCDGGWADESYPDGTLDTSFGTNGFNITTIGTNDIIYSLALQSDGKILAGGKVVLSGVTKFALARYNSDGSLDTSFGTDGFSTATFGTVDDIIYSIVLQPDGKILAGGSSYSGGKFHFALARYNSDGSLDTSFGTNGFNIDTLGTNNYISSIVFQPDGKIIAGGYSDRLGNSTYVFALTRYNSNGSLDTSFGTNGFNFTTPSTDDQIASIVLQPDGKTVAGGFAAHSGNRIFALARYNSNGSLDTSFGTNGFNLITPTTYDQIYSIVLQPDGKIIAGGYSDVNYDTFSIARYNSDGSIDTSFGDNGFNLTTPGIGDQINSVIFQPDGKIVAGGSIQAAGSNEMFALTRYHSDGSLDKSFATGGYNFTTPSDYDQINSIVLQSDGKIVAGGYGQINGDYVFALARYN